MYYHATDMKNLGSIMETGIKPSRFDGHVYLADSYENAIKFVMFRGYKDILVLPCKVISTCESSDHSYDFFKCKAYMYYGIIKPSDIDWNKAIKYPNPLAYDISKVEEIGKTGRNSQV